MSSRFFQESVCGFVLFFAACQGSTSDKPSEIEVTSLSISSLGSSIAYTDTKKGDTTLLFIHGWGINRRYEMA